MSGLACPECGATEGDVLGHEVSEVYDGVLFWSCLKCIHAWPRDFAIDRRRQASERYVAWFIAATSATRLTN